MGRTGIYELLVVDDDIRQLIMDNVDSNTIKKRAIAKGMLTLRDDGARKVMRGDTSIAEILRVTQDDMLGLEDARLVTGRGDRTPCLRSSSRA
jgi:general secretion pathway protein E